ncbi:hypothetical protein F5884DRAFT_86054 [Xylogone sp. PMI_703]|nr:hypothetical protein F5884DRAFT_86054 [Xylogone sp. PMI_703]
MTSGSATPYKFPRKGRAVASATPSAQALVAPVAMMVPPNGRLHATPQAQGQIRGPAMANAGYVATNMSAVQQGLGTAFPHVRVGGLTFPVPPAPQAQQVQAAQQPAAQSVPRPMAQSIAKPTAQSGARQAVKPGANPTARSVAKPMAQPGAQPVAQPVPYPTAQSVAFPFAQPVAHPAVQSVTQPAVSPALQQIANPVANPFIQSAGQPVVHPTQYAPSMVVAPQAPSGGPTAVGPTANNHLDFVAHNPFNIQNGQVGHAAPASAFEANLQAAVVASLQPDQADQANGNNQPRASWLNHWNFAYAVLTPVGDITFPNGDHRKLTANLALDHLVISFQHCPAPPEHITFSISSTHQSHQVSSLVCLTFFFCDWAFFFHFTFGFLHNSISVPFFPFSSFRFRSRSNLSPSSFALNDTDASHSGYPPSTRPPLLPFTNSFPVPLDSSYYLSNRILVLICFPQKFPGLLSWILL